MDIKNIKKEKENYMKKFQSQFQNVLKESW